MRAMEREDVAQMIITTAMQCAEGYRRGVNQWDPPEAHDVAEKCAIAASNTGWFMLIAMGYKPSEIMQLKSAHGQPAPDLTKPG